MEKREIVNDEFDVIENTCEAMKQYREIYKRLEETILAKNESELDSFEKMIAKATKESKQRKIKTAFLKDEKIYFVLWLEAEIDGTITQGDIIIKYDFLESKIQMVDSYLQFESEDEFETLEEVA